MSFNAFWPSSRHINECIRTEAETTDEAVLLAVHQAVRLQRRHALSGTEEAATEADLLKAFLTEAVDGGTVLLPITGPSGVGKSHMIRWLRAQITRHERAASFHVISVPKYASLRSVVELILQPLEGTSYDQLRLDLTTAIGSVDERDAAYQLATQLALGLERRAKEWRAALKSGPTEQQRLRVHAATNLPTLLRDAFFLENVFVRALRRIVRRSLTGSAPNEQGIGEDTQESHPQFLPDDLVLPNGAELAEAAPRAQQYYATAINAQDGKHRKIAIEVLNDVIDAAISEVFQFAAKLHGMTIGEIVDKIRENLLRENKELILLIEDFAALSGIQEPLLKLSISESERAGKQIRAVLRTALAVTDGFLPQRDTIMTRAKAEWVIQSRFESDSDTLDQCVSLAGRYLNAARWGRTALSAQFERGRPASAGLYGWVEKYPTEDLSASESDQIKAFGESSEGYALFPFNRCAIESLCRVELRQGDLLVFNPRLLINAVLRETLLLHDLYLRQGFPPASFKGASLSHQVATALSLKGVPSETRARLASFLWHWGGNPQTIPDAARTSRVLYQAFALPFPFAGTDVPISQIPPPTRPDSPPATGGNRGAGLGPLTTGREDNTELAAFSERLQKWAESGRLEQVDAREIRQLIVGAIAERTDWNALRMTKVEIAPGWIWLPDAKTGNPTVGPVFKVAESSGDEAGFVRAALVALYRRKHIGHWDYPLAEDDYAFAWALIEPIQTQIERHLESRARERLAGAVRVLSVQSSLLGIRGREDTLPGTLERCFGDPDTADQEPAAPDEGDENLSRVREFLVAAALQRPALKAVALQYCACYQGDGKKVYAVDAVRIDQVRGVPLTANTPVFDNATAELQAHVSELSGHRLDSLIRRLYEIVDKRRKRLQEILDLQFDKKTLVVEVHGLLQTIHDYGLAPAGFSIQAWRQRVDQFRAAAVEKLRENVADVPIAFDSNDREKLGRVLGRVNYDLLAFCDVFFRDISDLIKEVEHHLDVEEKLNQGGNFDEALAGFISNMEAVEQALQGVIE